VKSGSVKILDWRTVLTIAAVQAVYLEIPDDGDRKTGEYYVCDDIDGAIEETNCGEGCL